MKTMLLTPICAVLLALAAFTPPAQAIPVSIAGQLSYSGTATMNGTSFLTATKFTVFQDVFVAAESALAGDYSGSSGAEVSRSPFTFHPPTTSTPFTSWSYVSGGKTYSFDLDVMVIDFASANGLLLHGFGTAYITGAGSDFIPTPGRWDFSAQAFSSDTFTFSSTTTVPPPSVPDGGSTVALLGMSLCGLFVMRREQLLKS